MALAGFAGRGNAAWVEHTRYTEARLQLDSEGTASETVLRGDGCAHPDGRQQALPGSRSLPPMGASSFGSAFGAVDLSADPGALREYLARVRAVPAVRTAKRESFALLRAAPGHRLLDLGCGQGDDVRELAETVGQAGLVVGVDKSEVLIEQARRLTPPERGWIEFACAEANALPFAEASFDACRANRTIQHVADADVALAELARVTRPGGSVVISEMLNALDLPGDEPDPIAGEVLARFWSEEERRGWIGFLLPPLLQRAGLSGIELHRRRERLTSFADAELLLQLPKLCAEAVAASALKEADARTWLEALERDFAAGRAALESEFFHLKASKPRAPSTTTADSGA
jgi:ubiquinone/menaquinone biosynthesis C-methylase UbiE